MQTKLVLKQRSALKLRFQPGATGPAGTITVGTVSTGAPGSSVVVTNVGTPENAILNFTIPEGEQGIQGLTGNKGWSPAFAIVSDGARRVLRVSDWVGGEGVKPAAGDYVGAAGLTPTIGDAIDIRGPAGTATIPDGDKGDITTEGGGDTWTLNPSAVASLDAFTGDSGTGGAKGLVPAPASGDKTAFLRGDGTWYKRDIVVLVTGQSNVASQPALSWTPPPNLFIWDWDNANDTDIGTSFSPVPNNKMGLATGIGEQLALAYPEARIRLVNIGKGSQAIAQWKTGAASPDMFKACEQNVEAALAVLGLSKIDYFVWWQGESDAATGVNNQNYPADFETVITRFRGQPWFPRETPCAIMALSQRYVLDDTLVYGNHWLRECDAFEPETRVFVDTGILGSTYWDATTDNLHMTAVGYRAAGDLAFDALEYGRGQNRARDPRQVRYKKYSQNRASTTTLADDPELRVWLRSGVTYRIKFHIVGFAAATPDFKYGWAHGTSNLVVAGVTTRTGGVSTVSNFVSTGIPSGGTVTVAADQYFFLDGDFFANAVNATGWFKFQWAQNTSDASPVYVFAGSYVEAIELR